MPIYEYKCEDCGHEFEEMLHFSERDDPLNTQCSMRMFDRNHEPQCFDCKGKLRLKMSMSSFHLKGGGWYKDGYGLKPEKKEEKKEEKKPEAKDDKKPKAKDDKKASVV